MSTILVCPLSRLAELAGSSGAEDIVTLMTPGHMELPRLSPKRHLRLELSDITEARDGHVLPGAEQIEALLRFSGSWNRRRPLLIHCYAGVSRSTAAAFLVACALQPHLDEADLAVRLRARSPTATPNARIVALGDRILARSGRMIRAIAAIGRGADCFEGVPFRFDIKDQIPPYQS